jgi:hypothetical protein
MAARSEAWGSARGASREQPDGDSGEKRGGGQDNGADHGLSLKGRLVMMEGRLSIARGPRTKKWRDHLGGVPVDGSPVTEAFRL